VVNGAVAPLSFYYQAGTAQTHLSLIKMNTNECNYSLTGLLAMFLAILQIHRLFRKNINTKAHDDISVYSRYCGTFLPDLCFIET